MALDIDVGIEELKERVSKGDADAHYNLGERYANGMGVEKDDAEAFRFFKLAAEQGHPEAQYRLGLAYSNMRADQSPVNENYDDEKIADEYRKNVKEEMRWFVASAENGNEEAQYRLGHLYDNATMVAAQYGRSADPHVREQHKLRVHNPP